MAKQVFIESDGALIYWMFGDRYVLQAGKHDVMEEGVLPLIGGAPGETDRQIKERIAQKLKAQFPQKITLSVEYPDAVEVAEPVVEAVVEAAPPVEAPQAKPVPRTKPPKKATKAKK